MTKHIFRSICLAATGVLVSCVLLFLLVLYDYFGDVQKKQLEMQTGLAAHAVANEGIDYFDGLNENDFRITWIASDGKVLYDNRKDTGEMENHMEREEIKEALESGKGESTRYSSTLMERALYCARRLPDGSVIRLSVSQDTLLTLLLGMSQPIIVIVVIAVILSMILAFRLSKRIVRPLNSLDLDNPLSNEGYDELSPLLRRIDSQQKEIGMQREILAKKQREFDTVTENMAEGIITLNPAGEILSINSAAKRLFGAESSCAGQHFLTVNRSATVTALLESAKAGRRDERMIDLSDGRCQMIIDPVMENGTLSGSVLLVIDVTEKEKAEQMRREFTANVSHELKTPLQTIAGSAELLSNGIVKEEDRKEFYSRIQNEAGRMIRLVDDIIRLSHLDEGADNMKREETDLLILAEETVKSLRQEADEAHVTVSLDGESAPVYGVPLLLRSIIFNLCDNAIKYNRKDGSVSVSVKNENDSVVLSVSDTGIGIPPEHQDRIFERFYRVDKSRSKKLGGTGLGLSIVKHAARLHDAVIDLQSVENGGTTISVTFKGCSGHGALS